MTFWAMTTIIIYKSLWWIIPALGFPVAMAIIEHTEV